MNPRITPTTILLACLIGCFAAIGLAQETEKPVKMKDLPPAVQTTVKEVSKGAKLRGLAMETENGKTFYEAELMVNGHSKDVTIDPAGNVVTVEEQVALNSLPPAVKAEIVKQAGKGRIGLVESVTENNALAFYEAHIKAGGKTIEVKVTPEGKLIQ
ncbi:MAG: hypothetical protein JST85_13205 [Acidobacteria bacterium]|nr:hypothetical protein [Acidobacteriota bacterium]